MRKIWFLLFSVFILSGCATYKFQKPNTSSQGYLAYYDGTPIAEYTVGNEKTLPDLSLAKERFKRRRSTVEYYYKQMDQIESRLKAFFWEPPAMIVGFLGGVLRWPFIAVADYRYNHNFQYKAKVDRLDEEKEALETARVGSLRKELGAYIAKDLAEEAGGQGVVEVSLPKSKAKAKAKAKVKAKLKPKVPTQMQEEAAKTEVPVAAPIVEPVVVSEPVEIKPTVIEELSTTKQVLEPPVAVITAKPVKGYSPFKVNFSAHKSFSKSGRIVSYLWDFGDGDTSTQKNPENTYWSTTFGSRNFTVTLTVRDQSGLVSSTTSIIEVITY